LAQSQVQASKVSDLGGIMVERPEHTGGSKRQAEQNARPRSVVLIPREIDTHPTSVRIDRSGRRCLGCIPLWDLDSANEAEG
jgi:hypothetical protein